MLVASPAYLARCARPLPRAPGDLGAYDALVLRSPRTRRSRPWALQSRRRQVTVEPNARFWMSDPEALSDAALAGCGVALSALRHVHRHLQDGTLVRLLPQWWSDAGAISVYFASSRLMPAKTRAFVDHLVGAIQARQLGSVLHAVPAR